jgi:hypothetical protein
VSESGPPKDGNSEFILKVGLGPGDDGTAPQSLREALEAVAAAIESDDEYVYFQMKWCPRLYRDDGSPHPPA